MQNDYGSINEMLEFLITYFELNDRTLNLTRYLSRHAGERVNTYL